LHPHAADVREFQASNAPVADGISRWNKGPSIKYVTLERRGSEKV